MRPAYEYPATAAFLLIVGLLILVVGAICVYAAFSDRGNSASVDLAIALTAIPSGMLFIGIASVIEWLAKIEHRLRVNAAGLPVEPDAVKQ